MAQDNREAPPVALEDLAASGLTCREVPCDDASAAERKRVEARNEKLRRIQDAELAKQRAAQARAARYGVRARAPEGQTIVRCEVRVSTPAARRAPTARPAARRPASRAASRGGDSGDDGSGSTEGGGDPPAVAPPRFGARAPEWSLERFCGLLSRSAPELRAQVAGRLGSELEPAWAWLAVEADRRIEELRRDPALYDPWPARRSRPSRARSARAPVSARRLPTDDALLDIPAAVFIEALTGNVAAGGMVRCPLPDHEDRTPSCSIAYGLWHCHGCGAGGDVYALFAELEGYPTPLRGPAFVEVRRALLERFAGGLRAAA